MAERPDKEESVAAWQTIKNQLQSTRTNSNGSFIGTTSRRSRATDAPLTSPQDGSLISSDRTSRSPLSGSSIDPTPDKVPSHLTGVGPMSANRRSTLDFGMMSPTTSSRGASRHSRQDSEVSLDDDAMSVASTIDVSIIPGDQPSGDRSVSPCSSTCESTDSRTRSTSTYLTPGKPLTTVPSDIASYDHRYDKDNLWFQQLQRLNGTPRRARSMSKAWSGSGDRKRLTLREDATPTSVQHDDPAEEGDLGTPTESFRRSKPIMVGSSGGGGAVARFTDGSDGSDGEPGLSESISSLDSSIGPSSSLEKSQASLMRARRDNAYGLGGKEREQQADQEVRGTSLPKESGFERRKREDNRDKASKLRTAKSVQFPGARDQRPDLVDEKRQSMSSRFFRKIFIGSRKRESVYQLERYQNTIKGYMHKRIKMLGDWMARARRDVQRSELNLREIMKMTWKRPLTASQRRMVQLKRHRIQLQDRLESEISRIMLERLEEVNSMKETFNTLPDVDDMIPPLDPEYFAAPERIWLNPRNHRVSSLLRRIRATERKIRDAAELSADLRMHLDEVSDQDRMKLFRTLFRDAQNNSTSSEYYSFQDSKFQQKFDSMMLNERYEEGQFFVKFLRMLEVVAAHPNADDAPDDEIKPEDVLDFVADLVEYLTVKLDARDFVNYVELYVDRLVFPMVYNAYVQRIHAANDAKDSTFRSQVAWLRHKSLEELGIDSMLCEPCALTESEVPFAAAIERLNDLGWYLIPKNMLYCIWNTCLLIYEEVDKRLTKEDGSPRQIGIGADMFLPILIYVVIHADVPNIHANLAYVHHFTGPHVREAEVGYYLTCVEGALAYIMTLTPERLAETHIRSASFADETNDAVDGHDDTIAHEISMSIPTTPLRLPETALRSATGTTGTGTAADGVAAGTALPSCEVTPIAAEADFSLPASATSAAEGVEIPRAALLSLPPLSGSVHRRPRPEATNSEQPLLSAPGSPVSQHSLSRAIAHLPDTQGKFDQSLGMYQASLCPSPAFFRKRGQTSLDLGNRRRSSSLVSLDSTDGGNSATNASASNSRRGSQSSASPTPGALRQRRSPSTGSGTPSSVVERLRFDSPSASSE